MHLPQPVRCRKYSRKNNATSSNMTCEKVSSFFPVHGFDDFVFIYLFETKVTCAAFPTSTQLSTFEDT